MYDTDRSRGTTDRTLSTGLMREGGIRVPGGVEPLVSHPLPRPAGHAIMSLDTGRDRDGDWRQDWQGHEPPPKRARTGAALGSFQRNFYHEPPHLCQRSAQ